jgi:hypothetical protein
MNFNCGRTCQRFEWCRFSELFVKLGPQYVHSHVVSIKIEVRDLDALEQAAVALGLQFRRGQTSYKWYGRYMRDSQLPEGITEDQLGHCDHALGIAGDSAAYEIGIVAQADGSYRLLWDSWHGGYGLLDKIGENAEKLIARYAVEKARSECENLGWYCEEQPSGELLIYHPDGGTMTLRANGEVEADGFTGSACAGATEKIASALGFKTGETKKQEYNQLNQSIGQA